MKKSLILVKHSLPEIVENLPARDWHLTEEGIRRSERLAKRLLPYMPEALVSSVEPKARETADIIARELRLNVHVFHDLHEHDRSNAPYLPRDQFQEAVREFFLRPDDLVFGSETASEAHRRFFTAVHSVLSQHSDKTIVIVSHGTVISLFVSGLTGISDFLLWNELGLPGFLVLDMKLKQSLHVKILPEEFP